MYTIFIIEDDNALRNGLEFDLAAEGYSVVSAENGRTALERMDSADDYVTKPFSVFNLSA